MDSRWSVAELSQFSIPRLRGLDIRNKDEENLVQEVLNAKLLHVPDENPINFSSADTDNMTPEKEKAMQAEIDAKNAEKKAKLVSNLESESTISEPEIETSEEKAARIKAFKIANLAKAREAKKNN